MHMKKRVSNYELQCADWRKRFLAMDIDALRRRLPELKLEGGTLQITHFGRRCGVSLETGEIRDLDHPESPLSLGEQLNIYTLFAYAKPNAALYGEWLPFASLKDASVFASAFQKGNLEPFARIFAGQPEALIRGCEALGGLRLPYGDVGYELRAFDCMPVRFLFWDRDDEFDAQANILFDRSATDFIHVESTVTIASTGMMRIAHAAGLEGFGGFEAV